MRYVLEPKRQSADESGGVFGRNNLTVVVLTASLTHVVGAFQFAARRAFFVCVALQRVMSATHIALGRRNFSLGNSHLNFP